MMKETGMKGQDTRWLLVLTDIPHRGCGSFSCCLHRTKFLESIEEPAPGLPAYRGGSK